MPSVVAVFPAAEESAASGAHVAAAQLEVAAPGLSTKTVEEDVALLVVLLLAVPVSILVVVDDEGAMKG